MLIQEIFRLVQTVLTTNFPSLPSPTTLENYGILPAGATAKVVAFWGRMRGFITIVIWVVLGYVVYKIMNVIFVGTKAVGSGLDSVADAIAPEEPEPAGA